MFSFLICVLGFLLGHPVPEGAHYSCMIALNEGCLCPGPSALCLSSLPARELPYRFTGSLTAHSPSAYLESWEQISFWGLAKKRNRKFNKTQFYRKHCTSGMSFCSSSLLTWLVGPVICENLRGQHLKNQWE